MPFIWTKNSNRTRIARKVLEQAIATAVKESDPNCELFVGVFIERRARKSQAETNWTLKGIRFGKADRDRCSAIVASVVEKMQREFELTEDR